jgi:hypothetical protein
MQNPILVTSAAGQTGVNVPDEQYHKRMEPYVDPYLSEHLTDVFKFYRTANPEDDCTFRVNDIVATTTGHEPQTFRQFLAANKDSFTAILAGAA